MSIFVIKLAICSDFALTINLKKIAFKRQEKNVYVRVWHRLMKIIPYSLNQPAVDHIMNHED